MQANRIWDIRGTIATLTTITLNRPTLLSLPSPSGRMAGDEGYGPED